MKCKVLCAENAPREPLSLDGDVLEYVSSADYLGVKISGQGVTDLETLERVRKADGRP